MMQSRGKALAAVGCALMLVAGAAAASSALTGRALAARYAAAPKPGDGRQVHAGEEAPYRREPGMKLVVNGQEATLKDAQGGDAVPLVVGDEIYLPLQALGEALGKPVAWDRDADTVAVGLAPMAEDAWQLISTLEETHPAFSLEAVPAGYQEAKRALQEVAADPASTLADFTWAAMAYTASLRDKHTGINPFGGVPQPRLDIGWVADGERLLLTGPDGGVTATEVAAVGGVPTKTLFSTIDHYVVAENRAGRDLNHAQWAALPALLMKAGADFSQEGTLVLTIKEGGRETSRTVGQAMPAQDGGEAHIIATGRLGDVFYVDFNQCTESEAFQQAVSALRQAVAGGTGKVIIDVRGNGGGNSDTCVQLLEAMGMGAPGYGSYVRYSPLARQAYPDYYEKDSGFARYEPHPETARANPKVRLVVLTDEETFSSATMLGVYVRDGKLGTLIGRPSSNAPNSYGDILRLNLRNSGLTGTVSFKQFLRPDPDATGDTLAPDIETAVGEDALERALAFLAGG